MNTPTAYHEINSKMVLLSPDGGPVDPARVERIAHDVMEAMLDIESESHGTVHSTAVSVSGTSHALLKSGVTGAGSLLEVEFAVNAGTLEEASDIAQSVLKELLHVRMAQHMDPAPDFEEAVLVETKRELDMVS
jgi:hypothetical protein